VLVTMLEPGKGDMVSEPGDYLRQLVGYEDRLARGEIPWQ
jgi:hypothetical protein